jgi:hypothetical protein
MLIQSTRRDNHFDPRVRIGFVVLINQAMEVLVHFKALIVILELLVWIVALLAAKEGPEGVPMLLTEAHLGGVSGEYIITVMEDNPTVLVQQSSLASRSGL